MNFLGFIEKKAATNAETDPGSGTEASTEEIAPTASLETDPGSSESKSST